MDDSNAQQSGEDDLFKDSDTKSKKSEKRDKGDGEESDEENQQLESNISKALSDSITKVVVILVLIMLFLLPVLDTYTYIEEQLIFKNSIDLMVKQYNDKVSWLSYQNIVWSSEQSMRTWDDDGNKENYYPAIVMKVADPYGTPWNTNLVNIYPSAGDMDTNVDNYRSAEKNNVGAIANNGL